MRDVAVGNAPIGGSEQLAEDGSQEGKGQKNGTVGLQVHGEETREWPLSPRVGVQSERAEEY
jgi:hypothetical protein